MKILVIDDEPAARYGMLKALRGDQRQMLEAADGQSGLSVIREAAPDLVFLDLNMPQYDGMYVLRELQKESGRPTPEIIVVTANDTVSHAVECIRCGATDFLTKPYDVEHVRSITRRTEERVRLQQQLRQLEQSGACLGRFGGMIGSSRSMQELFSRIGKAARTSLPVLIRGESGTGKELVARELHSRSTRAARPFVAVNTAAIAESLIESELFGHVKGAFTGADRNREGVFRQANGGSLFLDEIGDMPLSVQTRLLRVLQERIVQPVGTEEGICVDVRIISATHQPLEQAITDKLFRQDLYFRLKGIELHIPPLRTRREDILLLVSEFLKSSDQMDPDAREKILSDDAVSALLQHAWPGNVRELQQTIASAVALSDERIIQPAHMGLAVERQSPVENTFDRYVDLPLTEARTQLVEDFERTAIARALEAESGNVSAAARRLQIHRQNLQLKMKQLGVR